ncbi:GAF domain-containing protein [Methylobacterium sp. P5_C11]
MATRPAEAKDPRPPAQASGRLTAARSREDIVAILRETARETAGADGIAMVLREGDTMLYAAGDAIEPLWRGRRFPVTECVSERAMLDAETIVVLDIECDPRVPAALDRLTSMRSLVMMPIGSPEPVAALGAYGCASVIPDGETVRRLERMARHAAVVLARLAQGGS